MIISFQGIESFKISQGGETVAINPISKDSKFKSKIAGADITLITTNHPDLNGRDTTSRGDKESFVISGPGEYEVKDISIKGFLSSSEFGAKSGEKKMNTVFQISLDNINMCFLGALSDEKLSNITLEALNDIDILFVPIGGEGVLNAAAAYKLAVSLEPGIIIPMHYGEVGEKNALKTFLHEAGEEGVKPIDKLVLKRKDLEGKEGEVVILSEE
ncbi:MAG: MBL fold metallo-hydrolase [bacterium]|nr:MBL fold metallo-hydrolase [bacterium]